MTASRRRPRPLTSREKVKVHRDRLRSQGLRPIQIWVPDVRSPAFAAAARKQSQRVAAHPGEASEQAFIDAVAEDPFDTGSR